MSEYTDSDITPNNSFGNGTTPIDKIKYEQYTITTANSQNEYTIARLQIEIWNQTAATNNEIKSINNT